MMIGLEANLKSDDDEQVNDRNSNKTWAHQEVKVQEAIDQQNLNLTRAL